MKELILKNDPYKMNWIDGKHEWGDIIVPPEIHVNYNIQYRDDEIIECFEFVNISEYPVFVQENDIGIYCTFNDSYEEARISLKKRCHTHIWCGENVSYIKAIRMGGDPPHLGLVLTKGSLSQYSIERKEESNDRGDFILHPSPFSLEAGEKYSIEWVLFSFIDEDEFISKIKSLSRYIHIEANQYFLFKGEDLKVKILPMFKFDKKLVNIFANNIPIAYEVRENEININMLAETIGEVRFDIQVNGIKTHAIFYIQEDFETLLEKRIQFIVSKQQYLKEGSSLEGAFLIYDLESQSQYYSSVNDHNGSRERIGMGVLLVKYLQKNKNDFFYSAFLKYLNFVERELFNNETGRVYNDIQRKEEFNRLYNYPWFSTFFLEVFRLTGEKKYLVYSKKIMEAFYDFGGEKFYAIDIHMSELIEELEKEALEKEARELSALFVKNADTIININQEYPCHEVKYEQSIVAPAAWDLLEVYRIKGEKHYLENAEIQIRLLELFNGHQPHFRLHETAIRHWDGFWFGKRKMYGDTFPHYWSALSGNVFLNYYLQTNQMEYLTKAEHSLRGVLSMFGADGTATCAYVYPLTINGQRGKYADPWANDQDWGLYYYYCHRLKLEK